MNDLFINPSVQKTIDLMASKLPQSLLLTGKPGVGLGAISRYIAEVNGVTPEIFLPESNETVDLDKGSITVDIMRRMYDSTRTKATKKRIIIIDYAERMTHQAQNAFLKLLEEPNDNVHFMLISHSSSKLLPTILSRVEKVEVKPISTKQTEDMLDELNVIDKTKRSQLLYIAKGLPAELRRLISDEAYFKKRSQQVRDAREIINGDLYQKILIIQKYKDSRQDVLNLLTEASNILSKSVFSNPQRSTLEKIDRFLETYQRIEANGNIRLSLAKLVI